MAVKAPPEYVAEAFAARREERNVQRQRKAAEHLAAYLRREAVPMPGDAVRSAPHWPEPGTFGVIDGTVDQPASAYSIIFNPSSFRGPRNAYVIETEAEYVDTSGGPGTFATPISQLRWTGETRRQRFWCWRDIPRGGGGEDYYLEVPVWELVPTPTPNADA